MCFGTECRTLCAKTQTIDAGSFTCSAIAAQVYFFALTPRSLSFMEMTRETPFSCCETP